jgi:hypothetical protein
MSQKHRKRQTIVWLVLTFPIERLSVQQADNGKCCHHFPLQFVRIKWPTSAVPVCLSVTHHNSLECEVTGHLIKPRNSDSKATVCCYYGELTDLLPLPTGTIYPRFESYCTRGWGLLFHLLNSYRLEIANGSVVVKALCYKPECRGFDTR